MIAAVLLAAAWNLPAPDAPPSPLRDLVEAAGRISVVRPGTALENATDRVGSLTVEAVDGTAFALVDGTGAPVGVFLQGKGRFRFHAADRTAAESLRASRARNGWNLPLEDDAVAGAFDSALILFTRPMFEALSRPRTAGDAAPAALDAVRFRQSFREVERLWLAWEVRAAENRLDPTSGSFAVAWFDAPSPVGWTWDASDGFHESLFYPFGRPESTLVQRPLAGQPIDGGPAARTPPLELASMTIDLVQDDALSGHAVSTFDVRATRDGARIARFTLTSLDTIARVNNGLPAHLREIIAVERVEDSAGNPLPWWHSWSRLLVDLGPGRRAGDTLTITVRTRRKQPGGFVARQGKGAGDSLPPAGLVPYLDNAAPWRAVPIQVVARLDAPYRLAFAGMPEAEPAPEGRRTFRAKADLVPESLWIGVVRDVLVQRSGTDSLPITLAYSPGTSSTHVDRTLRRADAWSAWLAERLGPAPYSRIDIDAVGNLWTTAGTVPLSLVGIAAPSACPVSEDFASSDLAGSLAARWLTARAAPASARETVFVRELADYLGDAAIDANDSPEGGSCLKRRRDDWKMRIGRCRWSGPVEGSLNLYVAADSDCLVGRRAVYGLDLIRTKLGDEAFFGAIRRALEAAIAVGRSITVDDLARETGQPALWDAVFRRFDATPVLVREGLGDGAANVGDPSRRTP